jgi:effector-binding domain-containing protein
MNFISIDPKGSDKRNPGKYCVGYTRGYYGVTNGLEDRMLEYMQKNLLSPIGPAYNVYMLDEISIRDPDQYLLQACVMVE